MVDAVAGVFVRVILRPRLALCPASSMDIEVYADEEYA